MIVDEKYIKANFEETYVFIPKKVLDILDDKEYVDSKHREEVLLFVAYLCNSMFKKHTTKKELQKKSKELYHLKIKEEDPEEIQKLKDSRKEIIKKLRKKYKSDYVNINSDFIKIILPIKNRNYNIGDLTNGSSRKIGGILSDILESDNHYINMVKPIGYKITDVKFNQKPVRIDINEKVTKSRIEKIFNYDISNKKPKRKELARILEYVDEFTVDVTALKKSNKELYEAHIKKIKKYHSWKYKYSYAYGRLYNKFTNLKKEIRPFLQTSYSYDDELVEIDITNSQLNFVLPIMDKDKYSPWRTSDDYQEFVKLVMEGEILDVIQKDLDLTRDKAKVGIFRYLMFSYYIKCHTKITGEVDEFLDKFNDRFPNVYNWFRQFKYNVDGKNQLWRHLQEAEGKFMIDGIAEKLLDTKPFFTIHDAIICHKSDVQYIVNQMQTLALETLGYKLPLKIKYLKSNEPVKGINK
ncbi:hypothetical protein OAQ99_04680 [Candidatus Kapabacteria bacterium]|nr:hypothetical protein [Candidatus Kapabacteria bacterium]